MSTIQMKRGPQEGIDNLVLLEGEFGVAVDTGNVYVGITAGKKHLNPPGGTADTAEKLATSVNFSATGDVTAPAVSFDGSQNVQLVLSLAAMAGLSAGTYTKLTVDSKGRVTAGANITIEDLPSIPANKVTGLGEAASLTPGTAAGNVVVVQDNGKISPDVLPEIAISEVFEADSESAMLALNAQKGDICIRSDETKSYILAAEPASTLANWKMLKTPDCQVLSVNGKTGAVSLTYTDVNAAPATHVSVAASADTLGHVKIGEGLIIKDGVVSIGDIDGGTF